jgi:hypothetical protein
MMLRRCFLTTLPVGFWGWRIHQLCRHVCARGGVLRLTLQGEPWKLTPAEQELIELISTKLRELEPAVLQEKGRPS